MEEGTSTLHYAHGNKTGETRYHLGMVNAAILTMEHTLHIQGRGLPLIKNTSRKTVLRDPLNKTAINIKNCVGKKMEKHTPEWKGTVAYFAFYVTYCLEVNGL